MYRGADGLFPGAYSPLLGARRVLPGTEARSEERAPRSAERTVRLEEREAARIRDFPYVVCRMENGKMEESTRMNMLVSRAPEFSLPRMSNLFNELRFSGRVGTRLAVI